MTNAAALCFIIVIVRHVVSLTEEKSLLLPQHAAFQEISNLY